MDPDYEMDDEEQQGALLDWCPDYRKEFREQETREVGCG